VAGYSIVNLMDIDNSAGERAPGMEARFARKHIDSDHLGVTYMRYEAGVRSPMAHSHREQEEVYVVIAGSGRVRLADEFRDVRRWDVIRVSPETIRAWEAGSDGLELIVAGSDRPEGGDGVIADSLWLD
jgi:mannose-6-phosphate isomerase-like protein (cupin superfamily)